MSDSFPFQQTSTWLSLDQHEQLQKQLLGNEESVSDSARSLKSEPSVYSVDAKVAKEGSTYQTVSKSSSSVPASAATASAAPVVSSAGSSNSRYIHIEHVTGYVTGEFDCVLGKSVKGKLYAGCNALYFIGSYFLFEKKVVIPWEDIRQVQKIDQGIEVVLKEVGVHEFTGLHAPDRVWVLLVSLHNDALLDYQRPQHRRSVVVRPAQRRNSDPLMASTVRMFDDTIDEEDKVNAMSSKVEDEKKTSVEMPSLLTTSTTPTTVTSKTNTEAPSNILDSFFLLSPSVAQDSYVQAIERMTGKLTMLPIDCTYNKMKGKLYAGQAAVSFYGRRFFWDQQEVFIKWDEVQHLQIVDSDDKQGNRIAVGLQIHQRNNDPNERTENQVLRFLGMDKADQVYATLVTLQNANLTSKSLLTTNRPRLTSSMRRMNSDPNISSTSDDVKGGMSESKMESEKRDIGVTTNKVQPRLQKVDDDKDWDESVIGKVFVNHVVKNYELNCDLDTFFSLYIANDAEHSVSKFLESRGDSKLRASSWELEEETKLYKRTINYTHPVNAPMAPPTANARKEQSYRRYKNHGMCMWTKTIVHDVPMADCFYVLDRLRVEPQDNATILINMEFELTFVKSTMFRSVITKTTTTEVTKILKAWATYMSKALGGTPVEIEAEATATKTEENELKTANACWDFTSIFPSVITILLAAVLVGQYWLLMEVRGLKKAVNALHPTDSCNAVI